MEVEGAGLGRGGGGGLVVGGGGRAVDDFAALEAGGGGLVLWGFGSDGGLEFEGVGVGKGFRVFDFECDGFALAHLKTGLGGEAGFFTQDGDQLVGTGYVRGSDTFARRYVTLVDILDSWLDRFLNNWSQSSELLGLRIKLLSTSLEA